MNQFPAYVHRFQGAFPAEGHYEDATHRQYNIQDQLTRTFPNHPFPAHSWALVGVSGAKMADTAVLGQPVTFPFSKKTAKNRVMKSAMSERLATFSSDDPRKRGQPTEELIRLYETWATGEIGIIVTGNIQIKKDHLEATGTEMRHTSIYFFDDHPYASDFL